jgi:predicted DNA-binding protein YlxM (UPF0122 family)|tara:strand:+ start:5002 stop:5334 length:333 start_codon:yes stop_codon:yes gene_type:complete
MSKAHWRKWTDQEEAFILSLTKEGLSLDEIAERMPFRSKSAVYNRIYINKALFLAWRKTKNIREKSALKKSEASTSKVPLVVNLSDLASVISAICSFSTLVLLTLVIVLG